MSTYTREGRFTPININSDPSMTIAYNEQRSALQAKGSAIVKSQYQNLLNLELTHTDNQNKLNEFFKGVNEKINSTINNNTDLSDYNNVEQTLNVFDPLTKNPEYRSIILDNQYTKHYKEEFGKAEYYKYKANKDGSIGSGYSDYNYKELLNNYNKFKGSPSKDIESWGSPYTYKPYYDYTEEERQKINEFMKLPDKHSQDSMDSNGVTTTYTYEGKSADQIQKYLDANLSALAKEQMLLEGRVSSEKITDEGYIKLLEGSHTKSIKSINNEIARLQIFGKLNKGANTKEAITALELQRKEYEESLNDLSDIDKQKNLIKTKTETFANYYMNNKLAAFSQANANDRVSSELGTNSAFVNALNRQVDLWKFSQKFAEDQRQFEADQRYKYAALENEKYIKALDKDLIDLNGNPITSSNNGLGPNQVLTNPTITNENQQSVREQQEKELQGDIDQVLAQTLPHIKDAFGEANGETPFEYSQKTLSNLVSLSNKLQKGDKETLDLLHAAPNSLNPQQKAKQNILQILQNNDDKILAYKAYDQQKKQTINTAKQQVLNELKNSKVTIDQLNEALNDNEKASKWNYLNPYTAVGALIRNSYADKYSFDSLESLSESLVNNPELAEKFKVATKNSFLRNTAKNLLTIGETFTRGIYNHYLNNDNEQVYNDIDENIKNVDLATERISNIGTQAQLKINQDLNNSYFLTQKVLNYHKPLDTESPQSKKDLSLFNNEVTRLLPFIKESDADFNAAMITNIVKTNEGATLYYQPSEMVEGKLVSNGEKEKALVIDNTLVGMNIDDRRDKLLLGIMTLNPKGETPMMIAKGQVPLQYQIGTLSGNKFSSSETGQGTFIAKVIINGQPLIVPQEFNRPSEAEKFMEVTSQNVKAAVTQTLKFELEKQNKAPLTTEQKEELINSGLFKKMFDAKLKEAFEKGKVYSTFGVSNPNYSDLENDFLNN